MKGCIVKHAYYPNFTWKPKRYSGALDMLRAFPFRSQNISLVVELKADIWPIKGMNQDYRAGRDDPNGVAALYGVHKTVSWSAVPWEKYDVIISCEPIIPESIIKAYPKTLWVYNEPSHRCGRAAKAAGPSGSPIGGYDLFWDDYCRAPVKLIKIPQSISFPYLMNYELMRRLIKVTQKETAWIDSRHIVYESLGVRREMVREFSQICGLPICHAPIDGVWDKGKVSDRTLLAEGKMLPAIDYLSLLGRNKYFLAWRDRVVQGQAVLEAAGLGLIVIANKSGVYHKMLCHPKCLISDGGPPRIALRLVKAIEKDETLQQEILAYQDLMLGTRFWSGPLAILHKALEMKG